MPRVSVHRLIFFLALVGVTAAPRAAAQILPPPRPDILPGGAVPAVVVDRLSPRVTGNPFFHVWRPEDLDAGATSTAIVQHPENGFVFIGNSEGVLKYDGARWRLLPLPKSEAVLALAIDLRGRVWAAGENEIARLEPDARGSLRAVTIVHPLPAGEAGEIDGALAADDGVWFRGLQHVLRVGPDDAVSTWRTPERFGPIWLMDGAVHATVSEREIVRLDPGGKLTRVFSRDALRLPPNRVSPLRVFAARPGAAGETILLTPLGPVRWHGRNRTWRPIPIRPALFRDGEALAATFLPDGAMVFVGTRPGGILVTPEGRIERLFDRIGAALNPRVTHLAADRDGGLWATSREHVARVQVRSAFARHDGSLGLQGSPRQLLRREETLLVAHTLSVSRHVPWPGVFPPVEGMHRGADSLAVVDGRVFAAAAGLVELPLAGGPAKTWSDLALTSVTGLRAAPGTLLAGDAQGAWLFRREDDAWRALGRLKNLNTGVTALFDRGDGAVWGATTDGRIWRADFRGGPQLDAPVKLYGPAEGVPAPARLRRISFAPLGDATLATCAAWLLRFDPARDRFVPETRIAGIERPDTLGAEAVAANADGSCWLRLGAPDRRLLRVEDGPEGLRATELPAPMIRDLAAVSLLEDRRTLWVAGADLLVSIDLDFQLARPLPPIAVHLRRVSTTDGQSLWTDGVRDPRAPLALEMGERPLRFEFAAPTYPTDHRGRPCVQYRTQLVGLERAWGAWTAEPWRDFSRLPAGDYTFRVQASDQAGRVSEEATLRLVVSAPWWRTGWAWTGYVALAGLGALGGVRLRTRALRRRAERLETTVAARTDELRRMNAELARLHRLELDEKAAARLAEEQARLEVLRYQLNPHFLYNALNSIYSLALTTPPAAAGMVLKLADFCRVALERRDEEGTTLGAEFDKLTIYLEIEKVRWGESLAVTVEAEPAARAVQIPPFLLLPLVENAIKYGGATSPDELRVRVTARVTGEGALEIVVANTGAWVERGAAPHGNGKSSGIGLANLRQRLQRKHPGAHALDIEAKDGWVVVRLRIAASPRAAEADPKSEIAPPP